MTTNKIIRFATERQPEVQPQDKPSVLDSLRNTDICPDLFESLEARAKVGQEKYGVMLQTHNGRNAMADSYQEGLDLVMYLRQADLEGHPRAGSLLMRAIALTEAIKSELERYD